VAKIKAELAFNFNLAAYQFRDVTIGGRAGASERGFTNIAFKIGAQA
jgi:hypothetical protein